MIDFWKSLIGDILSWPVAVFSIGLLFRKPITALLGRIKNIKGPGFELSAASEQAEARVVPPPDALQGEIGPKSTDMSKQARTAPLALSDDVAKRRETVRNFGQGIGIVDEGVTLIKADLDGLGMPLGAEDTAELLMRQLATTQFMLHCERTHRLIFGSQILALHLMNNSSPSGLSQ